LRSGPLGYGYDLLFVRAGSHAPNEPQAERLT
jgi:hypothetical protein